MTSIKVVSSQYTVLPIVNFDTACYETEAIYILPYRNYNCIDSTTLHMQIMYICDRRTACRCPNVKELFVMKKITIIDVRCIPAMLFALRFIWTDNIHNCENESLFKMHSLCFLVLCALPCTLKMSVIFDSMTDRLCQHRKPSTVPFLTTCPLTSEYMAHTSCTS